MALTRPSAAQIATGTVNLTDAIIRINSGETGANTSDVGIIFERGSHTNAGLIWDESADAFRFISTTNAGEATSDINISAHHNLHIGTLVSSGLTYPSSDGTNGQALITNGAGTISFGSVTASPAGSDTQVQFNNNGSLGASANLTFDGTTLSTTGINVSGNISVTGTVDGRDVATDGSKLDGIETGATADQTGAEIKSLYEAEANTNAFTDAEKTKLSGIETGATADQTASEILTAIKTVDGSGSGLDADTLDGVQGSSFLRSDTADTIATNYTINSGNYLYYYDASQTDSNDGKIGVGMFGSGLNIVGVQSSAGDGRRIRMWGNVTQMQGEFQGTATSAKYADLAENYLADYEYPIGTVLDIGGEKEVTIATKESYRIAGTVSEKPGFLMNSQIEGDYITPVAYIGRVPCRVEGVIERGDILVVGNTPGVAIACHPRDILPGQAIGKALESYNNMHEGLIEILVGRL